MFKSCKRGRGLDRPGKVTVEVNFRNRVLVFLAAGKAAEKSEELVQLHTRVIGMSDFLENQEFCPEIVENFKICP